MLTVVDEDMLPATMNCRRKLSLQFRQRLLLVALGEGVSFYDLSLCELLV